MVYRLRWSERKVGEPTTEVRKNHSQSQVRKCPHINLSHLPLGVYFGGGCERLVVSQG